MSAEICLCGFAVDAEAKIPCETCHQPLCQTCFSWHPCLTLPGDFLDSPSTSPRESATTDETTEEFTTANISECHETDAGVYVGIAQLKKDVYVHCESFIELSYVTLSTDFCGLHCFGQTLADFQILCELCAWDLPEGIVVFNANNCRSLIFQSGMIASCSTVWSAIHNLRARQSIGLIMRQSEDGWFYYTLVEVLFSPGQTRKLAGMKQILTQCLHSCF